MHRRMAVPPVIAGPDGLRWNVFTLSSAAMKQPVPPIPPDYTAVTPYLIVDDAHAALDFYKAAFGATETLRFEGDGGSISHAELRINGQPLMLASEHPEYEAHSPQTVGGSPVGLLLYVEDVDATVARAVGLGAMLTRPVADQFYGDRSGTLVDPFGHRWYISSQRERLSAEEMHARASAAGKE
ncbi:VOC family protein [Jeongeupia chitinilytica]|uniref:Glyoxalase n=1 Tax=Jeongeupia chitinilytica TaxID=1041641 RepID=A0ABQ3GZ17_9NEIS|nr:VOC family protein [Jeongeupia chitinilytica]GHD60553.1 glyoxalase [Jeongeupia chitinilytica]